MSTLKLSFTNTYEHAVLTLKKGNKCNIRKMKHNALALKAGLNESGPMAIVLPNESYPSYTPPNRGEATVRRFL